MRPRKDLIEIFSTFLQFEADRPQRWVADPRLSRNMRQSYQTAPSAGETFWVAYWLAQTHQTLAPSPTPNPAFKTALGHLTAYLQEVCFWTVQRVMPRLGSVQIKLSDGFQVAIADAPKLLQAFDTSQPTSLKTYANTVFGNSLRDYLRQRREIDFCSDWGLLLKISRKRLLEALQANNLEAQMRDRYLLAWKALTAHYSPQKSPKLRTLEAPDANTWQAIVAGYNQECKQFPHLVPTDATTLEKCLMDAANKVRSYLYPSVTSLNLKKGKDSEQELQDDLTTIDDAVPMVQLIDQEDQAERQTQQQQMVTVLRTAIEQLDQTSGDLLRLYYQEHLTQQDIAKKLEMQQYTVSRRLTKARETLLKAVLTWGRTSNTQASLHIAPSSDVMSAISALLEDWLESFYNASERTLVR